MSWAAISLVLRTTHTLLWPSYSPSNTYVFAILAASDAIANIEKSPFRHKIPFAESDAISALFVIQ